jgi:hypothetical protein
VVPTLNELIAVSWGRYLARMDADDICRPQRVERQVAYLEAYPDCVAVGSRVLLIDADSSPLCELPTVLSHEEIDATHLSSYGDLRICHPTVVMRREAVIAVGKYCEETEYCEDYDLFLRLAEIGRLANLPEILLEYRRHPVAIGYLKQVRQLWVAAESRKNARLRRGLPPDPGPDGKVAKAQSAADMYRMWAWWALSTGNVATARKHALEAALTNPFDIENLRSLVCAIRGY